MWTIAEQVQTGYTVVYYLASIYGLSKLWLYPVAVIPQVGRCPQLIFDFTWSGLNEATAQKAPEEVMRFICTFHRIIRRVLMADPRLVPVYLGKVDLSNVYMQILFRLKETPSVDFLLTKKRPESKQLVGFHV